MDAEVIDYTTWRKGRKTGRGNQTVDVCPKCGRKGAVTYLPATDNRPAVRDFVHKKHLVGGFFWHVDEHCFVTGNE